MSEQVHGVCGACGSGITVEDGLVIARDDADLLAALEWQRAEATRQADNLGSANGLIQQDLRALADAARAAIAKAQGEV